LDSALKELFESLLIVTLGDIKATYKKASYSLAREAFDFIHSNRFEMMCDCFGKNTRKIREYAQNLYVRRWGKGEMVKTRVTRKIIKSFDL
jgi:hypothetical protein